MNLSKIISINGMPGLYKVVASSKNGVIVESLTEKKRFPVFGSNKISALEDISMFTNTDNKSLSEIMKTIYEKESGNKCLDHKANDQEVISYFETILPDYDKEKVFVSNMKKLFQWYNLLHETGNLVLHTEESAETESKDDIKLPNEEKAKKPSVKPKTKDTSKPAKNVGIAKKAAGVRKTGTA